MADLTAANAHGRGLSDVTVDGADTSIGESDAGSTAINNTTGNTDVLLSTTPTVINPPEFDPTTGVPAPPVASRVVSTTPPGQAGRSSSKQRFIFA